MTDTSPSSPSKQENVWLNLIFNIALPTLILMKLSTEDRLGPTWAVILGFSFPLGYGIYDYLKRRRINLFSVIGLIAVLVKGGTLIAKAKPDLIIAVETGVPLLFGVVILATAFGKKPLIQRMLLNPQVVDQEKIDRRLEERGHLGQIRPLMIQVSIMYAGIMIVSALLNFLLATRLLQSEPGSPEFVAEVGKLNGLQFPVIGLPIMVLSVGLLIFLVRRILKWTGLKLEEIMLDQGGEDDAEARSES